MGHTSATPQDLSGLYCQTGRFPHFQQGNDEQICQLLSSQKVLFIDNSFDDNFIKSIRNNHRLNVLNSIGINVLDVVKHDKICFSEEAFNTILARFK